VPEAGNKGAGSSPLGASLVVVCLPPYPSGDECSLPSLTSNREPKAQKSPGQTESRAGTAAQQGEQQQRTPSIPILPAFKFILY
jgi:hypothetical protein